ncbi:MAG TPA: glycerol-3-phosphate 1-O-acyltransferase PlsY [Thermoflexia bacterium]|nr:glycerol-3-phosphate 1-O-acyltransferase PlsY [Thermoflexia bacterium]
MTTSNVLIAILIGYALGSIQTAYFMGRLVKQIDIREHGSGNAGASNVVVVLGWKYGFITGVLDIIKAVIAVLIVKTLYPGNPTLPYLAGISAILGHLYPFYLGFRGGKGVACLIGMFFGLNFWWGLLLLGSTILLVLLTDYVVGGSLSLFAAFPIITLRLGQPPSIIVLSVILTAIIFYKHRSNVRRIINKEELTISEVRRRGKS